ncbi:MAG: DUF1570 domain-containing protein, partial [Planctomycetota bacterium]
MQLRWLLFALVTLALPARADRLITEDGRVLEVKKARKLEDGNYLLVFESGEVQCPAKFVATVEIEGDMSDYVPANEDERKKLADGYVRYRGKWLTGPAYKAELAKTAAASKARTAELAAHQEFYNGWKKETKHFDIQSNTSPEILDYYADLLETYYDMMDARVGINPSPTLKRQKMKVFVYKNRPEFTELTKVPAGVAGFFSPSQGELHFYHDYQDPSVSEWIALHEGTHLLTFLIEPQADPVIWINEGVADYFGSSSIGRDAKGRLTITLGQLSLNRVLEVQEAMAEAKHIPLEKLFMIPDQEFNAFEYAHAWSFVYFLNSRPEYEKGFKKFFKDFYTIAKGVAYDKDPVGNKYGFLKIVPPAEVRRLLLDRLGVKDVAKLEREWMDFIQGIPIDAPLARFKRGLDSVYSGGLGEKGKSQRAMADLDAAIEGGVDDPRAYWARAMINLIVTAKHDKSIADLRKAVELAPLQASFRANLAQILAGVTVRTSGLSVSSSDSDEEKLEGSEDALVEAELHFGIACE